MENYNIEHVPTEYANGGVLLYTKKAINYKLRPDYNNYTTTQNSRNDIYKRNFKHFRSKRSIPDLEKVNWDNILNVFEGNVNKYFQNFSNNITDILDKHVPITKLNLKEMKSSSN